MKKILVLEGDGIGPEIISSAVKIIELIKNKFHLNIELEFDYIGGACIDKYGEPIIKETIQKAKKYGVVLLGAVGGYKWDKLPIRPEQGLLTLRKEMGVFANLRPIHSFPVYTGPLKNSSQIDILFLRELTSGIYFGKPKKTKIVNNQKIAIDTMKYSEKEIERVVDMAFKFSQKRRKFLVSVDKANVLESSKLWREVVNRKSKEYPDVKVEHHLVDSFAMNLILKPQYFDVVVTENLFGDVLTDEAAVLVGSLGLLPSASLSFNRGLYEPIHGSAPDLAGKNIANPIGTILSVALMFKYSFNKENIHNLIYNSVFKTLEEGILTFDLNPNTYYSTTEITEKIIDNIIKLS